mgnify:CR=1 FL=1
MAQLRGRAGRERPSYVGGRGLKLLKVGSSETICYERPSYVGGRGLKHIATT